MTGRTYCSGEHCPIKNSCTRYTAGLGVAMYDGTEDRFMRQCRNERMFVHNGK